jgi:hypothetical protein
MYGHTYWYDGKTEKGVLERALSCIISYLIED